MLYTLMKHLVHYHHGFQVFHYLTLRGVLAVLTALVTAWCLGPMMIRHLTLYKAGQVIREEGPQTHLKKAGTPTMGGALILLSISFSTLLWADLHSVYIAIALWVMLGFGAIGWVDDYRKIVRRNTRGLPPRWKFFWQTVVAVVAITGLVWVDPTLMHHALLVPFVKDVYIGLGFLSLPFLYCVIVGSSNAVNLTDGLDGLAILPSVLVGGALGIFAYVGGHSHFSEYLQIPYLPGVGELAVVCGAVVGAGLGFLWFNAYPAQVFMGDVGALALGGLLGTMAIAVHQELAFFIMSGLFVVETISVILQVGSYRLTGKRIFKMAPIHHHFELKGWPEPRVIVRFWIITVVLVLIGLSTLKIR